MSSSAFAEGLFIPNTQIKHKNNNNSTEVKTNENEILINDVKRNWIKEGSVVELVWRRRRE